MSSDYPLIYRNSERISFSDITWVFRYSKRFIIFIIFTMCMCSGTRGADSGKTAAGQSLRFGAAVDTVRFPEGAYTSAVKQYFNCLAPENCMKWDTIQQTEGTFVYTQSDQLIDFASANGKSVRGHVLLWHMQVPAWVTAKSYSSLEAVLQAHINAVVGKYKGKIFAWDVANEIIMSGSLGLKNRTGTGGDYSIWASSSTDDSLIIKAFEFAHAADPDAKLFINDNNNYDGNDFSTLYPGWNQSQADLLYNYVKSWKDSGVPIHGVGMQLHLTENAPPDFNMIEADIVRYRALGLEVHFTEIDIRIQGSLSTAGSITTAELQHQAVLYNTLAKLAAKYPDTVTAFVTWGVSDKYSWIPLCYPGYDAALLLDENYLSKIAYDTIKTTLGL